jgi:hypothetical protein
MVTLAKGMPWAREVSAESIRLAEGTVDEKGIRHVFMLKHESAVHNRAQLQNYKDMGYQVADRDYEYELTIPDSVYREKIEGKQHSEGLRRVQGTAVLNPEDRQDGLISSTLETSSVPMTPEEILGDE